MTSQDRQLVGLMGMLVEEAREQGMETMRIPCDLDRLGKLVESTARIKRMVIEHVETRVADAIAAVYE